MRPMRSVLFVPGHKPSWAEKALAAGADGLILDLEDAVPLAQKAQVRTTVAQTITQLAALPRKPGIYVRVNALETGMVGDDLEQIVVPGLDGIVLPKVYTANDIIACDALIRHFERRNGVASGTIEIVVSLETAQSYAQCETLLTASPRVATLFAAVAKDGDTSRSVGLQFTPEGLERLYMFSRAHLAVRAAGKQFSWVGLWQDIQNLDGARDFAVRNRQIGFTTMVMIHPSHVPIANQVFTPSDEDVQFYQGMVETFEQAEAQGNAAVVYEGQHIDYAHVKTARAVLALHQALTQHTS